MNSNEAKDTQAYALQQQFDDVFGDYHYSIVRTADDKVVFSDGMEPDDPTFRRSLSPVVAELNRLAKRVAELESGHKYESEKVKLFWSDRELVSHPTDFANAVVACALDHCYDRTHTGVPYMMPKAYAAAFAPIVEKHLMAVEPKWRDKTVDMNEEQKQEFLRELTEAQEKVVAAINEAQQ